jgi:DNA-binding response OmpR family regulator
MLEFDDELAHIAALKVLVIEDDQELGRALVEMLESSGMQTAYATTSATALGLKNSYQPNIAVMDLNFPGTDGLALLSMMVRDSDGDCGLIIVSGRDNESDRVVALELGADDYICKPACARELLARIRAVHRRVKMRSLARPDTGGQPVLKVGAMTVDLRARMVRGKRRRGDTVDVGSGFGVADGPTTQPWV